jgi:hypothetical protein
MDKVKELTPRGTHLRLADSSERIHSGQLADGQAKFGVRPSQVADEPRKVVSNRGMPDKRARHRAGTDWERRLSAGFACRGLDAPGARSAAREQGGCPWRAAGRASAHVPSYQPGRRRAGWKAGDPGPPRRRRAGWKAGDPGPPRRRRAGWKAGDPGPPRRCRAGWKAGDPSPPRRCRAGWKAGGVKPAGKPAIPVRRVGAEPAGKPASRRRKAGDPSPPRAFGAPARSVCLRRPLVAASAPKGRGPRAEEVFLGPRPSALGPTHADCNAASTKR